MKTTSSSRVDEVRHERQTAIRLTIGSWEEEEFDLTIRQPEPMVTVPGFDWDDIEAVGAADDASRFRLDSPIEELTRSCP